MKSLFLSLALLFCTVTVFADITNGVFYVDNDVKCYLVDQGGKTITNQLCAGCTYRIEDKYMTQLETSNTTTIYFAGGPIVQASPNSQVSINSFQYEVKNLYAFPRKAIFGPCNLVIGLNQGEFVVVYSNPEPTSMLEIATFHTDRAYEAGKYVFVANEKETTVNVIEEMSALFKGSPNGKRNPTKNKTKTITTTTPLTVAEIERFNTIVADVEKKTNNVMFIVVDGAVKGVWMK